MNDKNAGLIDDVTLKLSGLIGVFDLIVNLLGGDRDMSSEKATMLDFAFFISKELQDLYKKVAGFDYNS